MENTMKKKSYNRRCNMEANVTILYSNYGWNPFSTIV